MALQVRRGTNAERQLITPLQGELIFTTDTKRLYVGDGTTQGGVSVDLGGAGVTAISDLSDVTISSISTGQVLKWNGSAWINSFDNTGTTISSINDINDVVLTTPSFGELLKFDGTNWINTVLDIQDDILPTLGGDLDLNNHNIGGFGDIDISGTITTSAIFTDTIKTKSGNSITINQDTLNSSTYFRINSNDDLSAIKLIRNSTTDISSADLVYGAIGFERNDTNGSKQTGLILGGPNYIFHTTEPTGAFTETTFVTQATVSGNTSLGIRTFVPTEALDVRGNGKFSGFVQFGSYTSVQRDALTPAYGMVIYNTTTNTFQGYQNTGGTTPEWVNLS